MNNNKYFLLMIIILFGFQSVDAKSIKSKLFLNKAVESVLKKNSKFELLNNRNFNKVLKKMDVNHPMWTRGDYNADGINDVVVYGVDKKNKQSLIYLVLFIKGKENKVYEVEKKGFEEKTLRGNRNSISTGSGAELKGLVRDTIQIESSNERGDENALQIYYYSLSKKKVLPFNGVQD